MSQHPVTITGHLTHDPKMTRLPNGALKTRIRIASSRRYLDLSRDGDDNGKNKGTWRDTDLLYIDAIAWGEFAINIRKSLTRGMPAIVVGSLTTEQWTDKAGNQQNTTLIRASYVGLDLNRHVVASRKTTSEVNADGLVFDDTTTESLENYIDVDLMAQPKTESQQEGSEQEEGRADDHQPQPAAQESEPAGEDYGEGIAGAEGEVDAAAAGEPVPF